jgi:hypothetical protein
VKLRGSLFLSGGGLAMEKLFACPFDMKEYEELRLGGIRVLVPPPDPIPDEPFVGREALIEKALAAWSAVDGSPALHIRLFGPPGSGKNSLVYELARILRKELYVIEGNDDLRVEDLVCVPVLDREDTNNLSYVASPLFAAVLRGGIAFFDEIAKAPAGALAALAPLLDRRGTLTSVTAAVRIGAAPGFLFCAALNEDEEKGTGLPDYIKERTLPAIQVGNPEAEELRLILKSQLNRESDLWIEGFVTLFHQSRLSPRAAIKLLMNAVKLYKRSENGKDASRISKKVVMEHLRKTAAGFQIEAAEAVVTRGKESRAKKEATPDVYNLVSKSGRGAVH